MSERERKREREREEGKEEEREIGGKGKRERDRESERDKKCAHKSRQNAILSSSPRKEVYNFISESWIKVSK